MPFVNQQQIAVTKAVDGHFLFALLNAELGDFANGNAAE